jgi:transposase
VDEHGSRCFTLAVPASATGMARLVERIDAVCPPSSMLSIGMEATGHYYENLFAYLSGHYPDGRAALILLNPLTRRRTRSTHG